MKKYNVNVNGTMYQVEIELCDEKDIKSAAPAPAPAASSAPAGGTKINAPMPGNILKINVKNGQNVKKGDVLLVLEAMKMENEILAPCDGTIASVNVNQGASVDSGALLCSIQ